MERSRHDMKDLFGNEHRQETTHVNIYADEIFSKVCPDSGDSWFYIGLVDFVLSKFLGIIIR